MSRDAGTDLSMLIHFCQLPGISKNFRPGPVRRQYLLLHSSTRSCFNIGLIFIGVDIETCSHSSTSALGHLYSREMDCLPFFATSMPLHTSPVMVTFLLPLVNANGICNRASCIEPHPLNHLPAIPGRFFHWEWIWCSGWQHPLLDYLCK